MQKVTHKSGAADTNRGPSPSIWSDLPPDIVWDKRVGVHVHEDFVNFGGLLASTAGRYVGDAGHYLSYQDPGHTIAQEKTDGGVIKITNDGTDNDESWIQSCGGTGTLGRIRSAVATRRKLWFETRIAAGQIAAHNLFSGLTEEGLAAADTQADSGGAFASKDMIGFQVNESTPTLVDIVYRKAGQSLVTVAAGVHTLVADTYVKLGFKFDPGYDPLGAESIRFFINGVEYTTKVTAAQIAATTFPDGEGLAWLFGGKNNNAANALYCDWFKFAQVF